MLAGTKRLSYYAHKAQIINPPGNINLKSDSQLSLNPNSLKKELLCSL